MYRESNQINVEEYVNYIHTYNNDNYETFLRYPSASFLFYFCVYNSKQNA